ncbi:MAG: pyruvate formate-lyase-activating protein [Eubacteriales bacterium]
MIGKIHSVETFGTVDGPGVRFVVFFQGCPMRCLYCHNPDTWELPDGKDTDSADLIARLVRNRPFYTTGGITATGGEPMLQMAFLTDLFARAKAEGIHTVLDTCGICFDEDRREEIDRLMEVTDLVMLDIKHTDREGHLRLTGRDPAPIRQFGDYLREIQKPVWIRHVVVPGITDDEQELTELGLWLKAHPNVEKLELLPYHTMGKVKYQKMGIAYPLGDTPAFAKEEIPRIEAIVNEAWKG